MKTIRFAIGQLNPTVGDYSANTAKILAWIEKAEARSADLIVFPELSLSGYPIWDLANKKDFVQEGLRNLQKIAQSTQKKNVAVLIGFIDRAKNHEGRTHNALAWIEKGKIRLRYYKRLLPTYDVFLEDIFFEPGESSTVIPWKGLRVGLTICEDIWDNRYAIKPLEDLRKQKANLVINISASPYYHGVAEVRDRLLMSHTRKHHFPMLYVNQVGGQDDLVFDGRSLFVDANGRVLFRASAFREDLFFFEWDPAEKISTSVPLSPETNSPAEIYHALVLGIRDYCRKNRFNKVLVGLSGGIDSAIVATLAVDALGANAVTGITMPGTYSSKGSWQDSAELAKRLGIAFRVYPIRETYEFIRKKYLKLQKKDHALLANLSKTTLALENLQARLRGLQLMYLSNDEGMLLLTTGNKSELAMGYCTLYGDMAGGLGVIGDVYKTDVYRLAQYRNEIKEVIPKPILTKAPSAELRPNQKDVDSLPPYDVLDQILFLYIEKNLGCEEIAGKIKTKLSKTRVRTLVAEVIRKVDHNEYKRRQAPPILRVTAKAWFGRRMPITNRFRA